MRIGAMEQKKNTDSGGRGSVRRLAPLVLLLLGLGVGYAMGWHDYLNFESLKENRAVLQAVVADYGLVAIAGFVALYALVVALSFPGGSFLTLVSGFLFGTWFGGIAAVLGATLGATAVFLAARTAFGDSLRAKAQGHLEKMSQGFERDAFSWLLVLRLVPLFPFFLVNLVPAFTKISLSNYVVATFVGILPGTFVYASIGRGFGVLFDQGKTPDLSVFSRAEILLPLIGLAGLSLVPVVYRRFASRNSQDTH